MYAYLFICFPFSFPSLSLSASPSLLLSPFSVITVVLRSAYIFNSCRSQEKGQALEHKVPRPRILFLLRFYRVRKLETIKRKKKEKSHENLRPVSEHSNTGIIKEREKNTALEHGNNEGEEKKHRRSRVVRRLFLQASFFFSFFFLERRFLVDL